MIPTKFHRLHYNFVAKRIRNHYPINDGVSGTERAIQLGARAVVLDIAIEFAQRFAADDPDFNPYEFLDNCSPDPEMYPFSEYYWEADTDE
jgi:hypothetical protein